jgi:HAMP domain-containing protein
MDSQYVVEIVSLPARPRADVVLELTQAFKTKPEKIEALLDRLPFGPAVVGKPGSETDAKQLAARFEPFGLEVRVRPYLVRPEMPAFSQPLIQPTIQPAQMITQPVQVSAFASGAAAGSNPSQLNEPRSTSFNSSSAAPLSVPMPSMGYSTSGSGTSMGSSTAYETETPEDVAAPVYDAEANEAEVYQPAATSRRVSLSSKFLFASILPTVLAVGMAIGAILLTVPNALRTLQLEGARNPAIALASGVEGLLSGNALDAKAAAKLQTSLAATKATLREQNVSGVFVTDALGNPVAGWFGDGNGISSLPEGVRAYVQLQARRATAQAYMQANNFPKGTFNPPSRLTDAAGTPLEVAAYPIQREGVGIGSAIYMMNSQVVSSRVQATVLTTLLASTLPIILAVMIAAFLARNITRNVIRLVKAADHISMGNLENPVDVRTNDELNELGEALERMRVSLHESLERLRKRRK